MAEIVDDFQLRIDAGIKGARAEFDEFVEKKKAEAAEQAESGKRLKEWAQDATRMRSVLNDQLRAERKQAWVVVVPPLHLSAFSHPDNLVLICLLPNRMVAKLIELGHDPRDVGEASQTDGDGVTNIFDSTTPLSDSGEPFFNLKTCKDIDSDDYALHSSFLNSLEAG